MAAVTGNGIRWFRGHERLAGGGGNDLTGHWTADGTGGESGAGRESPVVREWRVILCHAASGQEWSFVVESVSAAGAVSVVRLAVPDGRWLLESVWDEDDVRVV